MEASIKKCFEAAKEEYNTYAELLSTKYLNGDGAVFYGVHIHPADVQIQDDVNLVSNVFEDKNDALKLVKKYKKARFKAFTSWQEAAEFSVHGSENPNNNSTVDAPNGLKQDVQLVGEKPSQFRGPTSQNLVKLRKGIEQGDISFVQNTIWDNPRYLIGVGDTPSILQEGFRYNGLHVAAKAKNPDMCELILNTIANVTFIKKLYVDDKNPEERAKILLDLYLNTPDKGLHETPLHFAVKFGADKCVEVLVSFPQCDKNLRNKHGKLPNQIICDRYDGSDAMIISENMARLLQDNYYVPVLRSEDNCAPPSIGEPFSPTSPMNFNTNPMKPRMEIHAYAGPMNKEGADKFRKLWKTPPRTLNISNTLKSKITSYNETVATLKMRDHEKGLERLGSNLANKFEVGWKEYWPFLDSFIDITSDEGLNMFENYLSQKVCSVFNLSPTSSSPQAINSTRSISGSNSPPKLPSEVSPITDLCRALQACTINDRSSNSDDRLDDAQPVQSPIYLIDKALQVFAKRMSNDITHLSYLPSLLELEIKQFILLMSSYMDDTRFATVDFHIVHARLSYLIKSILSTTLSDFKPLCRDINTLLDVLIENYDCFSSDDEDIQNVVTHSKTLHMTCVLKYVLDFITNDVLFNEVKSEEDCKLVWRELKPCNCSWKIKSGKRAFGSRRSNSFKFSSRNPFKQDPSRKLSFGEEDPDVMCLPGGLINNDCFDRNSSDDEFYTPPSSPSLLDDVPEDNNDDECFDETNLPEMEMYIEGDMPTKVDCAVYNALNYAGCKLHSDQYPNIYKWHHAISLYNEQERTSWSSPSVAKYSLRSSPHLTSTPCKVTAIKEEHGCFTPPKSWLRITGLNSPRASLTCHKGNVSFNL